ncbi:MAG: hypothetical protein R3E87_10310 [Burkholderiaceae bacterium]
MTVLCEWVFKINPGTDPAITIESAKRAMAVWRKHGANPRLYTVAFGEVGCMSVKTEFAGYAEYGRIHDLVATDPDIRAWSTQNEREGGSTWIRSNILREVPA